MAKWLNRLKRNGHNGRKATRQLATQSQPSRDVFILESLENRILLSATPMEAVVITDKADYSPGETAVITATNTPSTVDGATFAEGEMVQFQVTRTDEVPDFPSGNLPWYVIDGGVDAYQTDVNGDGQLDWVRADNDGTVNGSISTTWFVEDQYASSSLLVTATGLASGTVATHEFTDAGAFSYSGTTTATIAAGSSTSVTNVVLTVPGNNGTQTPTFTFASTGSPSITVVNSSTPGAGEIGVIYTATSDSDAGTIGTVYTGSGATATDRTITYTFTIYVGSGVAANTYSVKAVASPSVAPIGPGSGLTIAVTVPAVNTAPVINRDNAAVTVNEGTTAINTGTWSDANLGDTVTLSASVGTVTKSGTNASGTWSWSYTPTDGPAGPTTVTITANDGTTSSSTTFSLTVNNVAPTIAISGAPTVNEGAVYSLTLGAVSDPGTDTVSSYLVHWGDGTSNTYGSNGVKTHTYADGPNAYNVTVDLIDGDGTFLNRANALSVSVLNVAPTATLQNNGSKTYGETVTISFTGASDPSNSDTSAGFHYAFATTAAGLTGVTYASGSSETASQDFTNLNAGNYTFWGRIIDQNGGFTDYSTNVTVSKATATVNVVDYTGIYDGGAHTASVTITGVGSDGTLASNSKTGTNVADSGTTTASISGLQNYNDASGTATLTINKANATVVVAAYSVIYDGSSHTASVTSITGVNGENGSTVGSVDLSGTTHTNAGTYTGDAWIFTGTGNYNNTSGTVNNAIAKATATVNVVDYTGIYDGGAHTASVTITGVGSDGTLASNSKTGTNVADSGTTTASISGLQNYNDASGTATLTINKAVATIAIANASKVFGQTIDLAVALGTTVNTGVNGENLAITYTSAGVPVAALVGPYAINGSVSNGSGLVSNYNVTINPGTLTVLTPSVITTVQDGANVLIVGTNGCDTIAVNATNPSAVTVNGTGSYSVGAGGHVIVYGMACDDNISLTGNVNLESHGGDGNDAISGGAGHDVLWGDQGNDTLTGAAGNDVLIGGDGSDRLVGSAGHDILVAGDLQGHNYDSLRTISDNWAANWIADGDLGDNNNDGDVVDEDADQLTGSSGHDWFIIGSGDKITDINSATKDGDKITNI